MTEHLSTEIVERFHQQALAAGERTVVYDHALRCEACRQQIVDPRIEAVALRALSRHLLPESENDRYHLDYEVIEGYVEDRLDNVDRDTAEMHLEVCAECSAEVTDLRESLATMRAASVPQRPKQQSIRERLLGFTRLPRFSTQLRVFAMVALAAIMVIAAVVVWRLKSGETTQEPNGGTDLTAGSKPTPIQSPSGPQADSSPLQNAAPSPNKLAESSPKKRLGEPRHEMIALNDGPNKITLDKSGKLVGLESLPRESQQAVKEALIAETIKKPEVLDELNSAEVSVRAPSGNVQPVRIIYPANTVIAEDWPLFEWEPSKTAQAYRVEIGDAGFRQVAKSENLPATTRAWTPPAPLKRGIVYTWVVREIYEGTEGDPSSSASQGKFKVLEDGKVKELNRLKAAVQSHLALGVFYARAGMIAEAEREFQTLVQENPHFKFAKKLLKELHSWQKR